MRNGNPIATDFGDEYCISYDGKEQRLVWALTDSQIGENLQTLVDKECGKAIILLPFEQQLVAIPSTTVTTNELQTLRFVLDIAGITAGNIAEICLQGTLDDINWFEFTNGSYKFIKDGLYTISVEPVIATNARVLYKTGTATVSAQIGGSY